jgi:hypothetical protein
MTKTPPEQNKTLVLEAFNISNPDPKIEALLPIR